MAKDEQANVRPLEASEKPNPRSDELPGDVPVGELAHLPRPGGKRRVLQVSNGWLVAADAGEVGAGLFLLARGNDPKRLDEGLPEPIRWMERFDFGIVGFAGHCRGDGCRRASEIYRVEPSGGDWTVAPWGKVDGCPVSIDGAEGAPEALLSTCDALYSVTASGVARVTSWDAARPPASGPGVAARDAAGAYYVSFGRYIGSLVPPGRMEHYVHCER